MSQQFLILGILLMPMQVWSLFLMRSRLDLSSFVLLLFVVLMVMRRSIRARSLAFFLASSLLHGGLLAWFGVAPAGGRFPRRVAMVGARSARRRGVLIRQA